MTCPACHTTADPALTIDEVHVCAHCGMSVVDAGVEWRRASYRDVAGFTSDQLQQLRTVSQPITRAFTLANKAGKV